MSLPKNWLDAKMCYISYLKASGRSIIVNNIFLKFFLVLKAKQEGQDFPIVLLNASPGWQRTRNGTLLLMGKKEVSIALATSFSKSELGRHQFNNFFFKQHHQLFFFFRSNL